MYYELAEVKRYYRKNSKGDKVAYHQIGLKKDSEFNEPKTIALVDPSEIEKIERLLDNNNLEETEAKANELSEEVVELKQQLQQLKEEHSKLTSEHSRLQNDYIIKVEELEAENKELTAKLIHETKLTKNLLVVRSDLLNRNIIDRLTNKEPESSKIVGTIKELPEIIESINKD